MPAAPRSARDASRLLLWLTLVALTPASGFAQTRTLHWDRLDVEAHLDADGTLAVTETQDMVFSGDWNGGERTFNIRPRQQLTLRGFVRDGTHALSEDSSLDQIDEYAWTDGHTLRWRSRLPSDPPFAATHIRYALRYTLAGLLLQEDGRYRLNHDFAFPDRAGAIERFALRLTFDPVWQPQGEVRERYTAGPLAPGRSFVLTVPLGYTGAGTPAALDLSRPPEVIAGLWIIAAATALAALWFFVREQRLGRFAPLTAAVDEAWLHTHVLRYPAEVVATAWDETVGPAEVVALIARLVSEEKLGSAVGKSNGKGQGANSAMTLRLLVNRNTFQGHERTLIDKLFFNGRSETSTSAVRAHYKTTGFNPATAIEPELKATVDALLPANGAPRRFKGISAVLFAAGLLLVVWQWMQGSPAAAVLLVPMFIVTVAAWFTGHQFRGYLAWDRRAALFCLTPTLAIALGAMLYLWLRARTGSVDLPPATTIGIVLLALACIHSSINALKSRRGRDALAFRKALTAGRAYFQRELKKDRPALRDAWYPWLIAFELGQEMDAWSVARPRGDTHTSGSVFASSTTPSSSSSSSAAPSWSGFSGGRAGGAGGGASWQAAAAGMAASISPPSSSSSGGSSGGGSSSGGSSGGGGGGGW